MQNLEIAEMLCLLVADSLVGEGGASVNQGLH